MNLLEEAKHYTMTGELSGSYDDLVLRLIKEIEFLQVRLDDVNTKDSVKTREINILVKENRELLARRTDRL